MVFPEPWMEELCLDVINWRQASCSQVFSASWGVVDLCDHLHLLQKKLLWWGVRAVLICGYKDRYLECSWEWCWSLKSGSSWYSPWIHDLSSHKQLSRLTVPGRNSHLLKGTYTQLGGCSLLSRCKHHSHILGYDSQMTQAVTTALVWLPELAEDTTL